MYELNRRCARVESVYIAPHLIGNSSSTWRCRGPTLDIIESVPLDRSGFMRQIWESLFDARGKIDTGVELNADPR
jgi:hypothetical protein